MKALLQEKAVVSKHGDAFRQLGEYIEDLHNRKKPIGSLEEFEREVKQLTAQVEREIIAEGLGQFDIQAKVIEVAGQIYRHVYRGEKSYLSAAGEIQVERSLYRADGGKAICPLEMQAGIVESYWTPLAARQGVWVTSKLPPADGEALFKELGNMVPSKSSLDRLSRDVGESWEAHREEFEATLCAEIKVPEKAVTMAASLDGVMVPMKRPPEDDISDTTSKDGSQVKNKGAVKAEKAEVTGEEEDKKKPFYKEASCGTLSFYDAEGKRLDTIRIARMPESGKKALKSQLSGMVSATLGQCPDLRLVKVADGAKDNWTFLSDELCPGKGVEMLDFFHAADHLSDAFAEAYGKDGSKAKAQFKKYKTILRDEVNGVEKIIRALDYLQKKHPKREKLATELEYFRNNRHRMQYATARAGNLPIGSGVTEAACKTMVTQRLKCSGMRWKTAGGQGVLTARGLIQSNLFDRGWELLSNTYRQTVSMPENVVLLHGRSL